ncbi:hypothetical protein [Thermocrinis jamiesonii]|jgi:hypothetical protein|uniref:hypothetical protein n=1 Tax=Thermocrinis jamiesonii TaxID=1302351 RepID=UPI000495BDA9|nr:hypothetical protein [Thermocrinis jamiesonii]
MEKAKRLLLECELALKERQINTALEKLQELSSLPMDNLTKEQAEELLRLIEHTIKCAEDYRNSLAQALVNLRRFKGV